MARHGAEARLGQADRGRGLDAWRSAATASGSAAKPFAGQRSGPWPCGAGHHQTLSANLPGGPPGSRRAFPDGCALRGRRLRPTEYPRLHACQNGLTARRNIAPGTTGFSIQRPPERRVQSRLAGTADVPGRSDRTPHRQAIRGLAGRPRHVLPRAVARPVPRGQRCLAMSRLRLGPRPGICARCPKPGLAGRFAGALVEAISVAARTAARPGAACEAFEWRDTVDWVPCGGLCGRASGARCPAD